jgi:Protein of unknown function (DUF2000)
VKCLLSKIRYVLAPVSERCVIVVDEDLPAGLAANAAAMVALTLGAREPHLVGADFVDADAEPHPGLIPIGLPVLRAPRAQLAELRRRAAADGVRVVDFPVFGQRTNDYDEFRGMVGATPAAELSYLGVAISGPRRAVARLTGQLALLR